MATLTWIGAGSAFNAKDGNVASVLEFGDHKVLLDCGFTVPYRLKELGLLDQITHVFISHTHSDHIGGLELLAQWRYFVSQKKGIPVPKLIAPHDLMNSLRSLEMLGLGSVQDEFGRPLSATLETYFDVTPDRGGHHFRDGDQTLSIHYERVNHVPGTTFPSYGFEIRLGNNLCLERIVFLTADTRDAHPLLKNAFSKYDKRDLIFHDCQLYESAHEGAGDVHVSLDKLIREIPPADRSSIWLVHYGENWPNFEAQAKEAGFAGFVRPGHAFDLWTGELVHQVASPSDN